MKPTDRRAVAAGIAGMMGAGKSTVARVFEEMGAKRIEADEMGKRLLTDPAIKRRIVDAFGEQVLGPDGEVDSRKLAAAAFRDAASARKLNEITRGPLISRIMARIEDLRPSADVIAVDAALLPEWGGHAWLDFLIVVDSDEEECVRRLARNPRFGPDTIRARMSSQLSRGDKKRYADLVIVNDGTLDELVEKARRAYEAVLRLRERSD
jgi:dephospho-CoA kinase